MYMKDLSESVRLRLSKTDMDFLRNLSEKRCCTISECIRSVLGEYRRSIESMDAISKLVKMTEDGSIVDLVKKSEERKGSCPNGDTDPYKHDKL